MILSPLNFFLLFALWLGLNGFIVFFLQLCLNIFTPWPTLVLSLISLAALIYRYKKISLLSHVPARQSGVTIWLPWILLGLIAFFITLHCLHYPLGGWDAWSCWNLKAKFIYLGHENFRDMFLPELWRSNTQYPLLLACINVWLWDLLGGTPAWGPMLISIILAVTSAAILLFTLLEFKIKQSLALAITSAIFLLPFNTTLIAGQYSDILVGLYLLCAFVAYLKNDLKLMASFIGLLSFTKTEGTVAAGILSILLIIYHRDKIKTFLPKLFAYLLPIIIFTLWMAPHNEAFVNGLTSTLKPSTWPRLWMIAIYPIIELGSFKWHGLCLIITASIIVLWEKLTQKKLQIFAAFFATFIVILLAYYQVNTFFEIKWWLDTTLHRIIFMLMPSLFLWIALAL